jgi:hypothetical protein
MFTAYELSLSLNGQGKIKKKEVVSGGTGLLILCVQCLLVWWWLCRYIEMLAQVLQVFLVPNLAARIACMTKEGWECA